MEGPERRRSPQTCSARPAAITSTPRRRRSAITSRVGALRSVRVLHTSGGGPQGSRSWTPEWKRLASRCQYSIRALKFNARCTSLGPARSYPRPMSDFFSRGVDRSRPIPPVDQPSRLEALVEAVQGSDGDRAAGRDRARVGARRARPRSREPGRNPVRRVARLAGRDRAGPRGPAAARPTRRRAGRHPPGPVPPLRGQRSRPRRPARAAVPQARGDDGDPDQRGRRREPGVSARAP